MTASFRNGAAAAGTDGSMSGSPAASTSLKTTSGKDRPAASALGANTPTNARAPSGGASRNAVGVAGRLVPSLRSSSIPS